MGHVLERKGQEATFEVFNDRLAVVKFSDGVAIGYDPYELLLPTDIDPDGTAYFEIRPAPNASNFFPLTSDDANRMSNRLPVRNAAARLPLNRSTSVNRRAAPLRSPF